MASDKKAIHQSTVEARGKGEKFEKRKEESKRDLRGLQRWRQSGWETEKCVSADDFLGSDWESRARMTPKLRPKDEKEMIRMTPTNQRW